MPVVKDGDEMGQTWDPRVTPHPIMPEDMVIFYQSYIAYRCADDSVKLKAALEALARRDQKAIEDNINPPKLRL